MDDRESTRVSSRVMSPTVSEPNRDTTLDADVSEAENARLSVVERFQLLRTVV